ncbi:hypothetical protein MKEN_01332400 [Mycena kentingensis (nom. inval.)]|nr:hypothetical protein MKEN_01332400 [Mycena kentingensis (nom. inval.)]
MSFSPSSRKPNAVQRPPRAPKTPSRVLSSAFGSANAHKQRTPLPWITSGPRTDDGRLVIRLRASSSPPSLSLPNKILTKVYKIEKAGGSKASDASASDRAQKNPSSGPLAIHETLPHTANAIDIHVPLRTMTAGQFVSKIFLIAGDPGFEARDAIRWSMDGRSLLILDQPKLNTVFERVAGQPYVGQFQESGFDASISIEGGQAVVVWQHPTVNRRYPKGPQALEQIATWTVAELRELAGRVRTGSGRSDTGERIISGGG